MAFIAAHQGVVASGASATTGSFTSSVDEVIVAWTWSGASVTHTISDSNTNTWTALTANFQTTVTKSFRLYGWVCKTVSGKFGAGHTVTVNFSPSEYGGIIVQRFSGRDVSGATSFIDAQGDGWNEASNATTHTGDSVTSTTAGCDIVCGYADDLQGGATNVYTAGSGFTIPTNGSYGNSGVTTCCVTQYQENVAAASYTGGFTTSQSMQAAGIIVALKAASGGGGGSGGLAWITA